MEDYPLSVFRTAIASAAGGLLTLIAGLSLGNLGGLFALEGWFMPIGSGLDILFVAFAFVGTVAVACIQLWGLLYVGVIIMVLYALLYDDASRGRTFLLLLFPQYACTVVALGYMDEWRQVNAASAPRILVLGMLFLLCALSAALPWLKMRRANRPSD